MLTSFERFVYVLCSPCIRLREAGTGGKGRIALACLMITYSVVTMSPKGLTASGKGQPCSGEACECCHMSQGSQSLCYRQHPRSERSPFPQLRFLIRSDPSTAQSPKGKCSSQNLSPQSRRWQPRRAGNGDSSGPKSTVCLALFPNQMRRGEMRSLSRL